MDRSGDHHIWTGAKKADGTGLVKVAGKLVTAHRAAWELANGPLAPAQQVSTCPEVKACVRLDHLSVRGGQARLAKSTGSRRKSPRGSGSKVQIRPGVWKITVNAGRYADGRQRRGHKTVYAATEDEATREQIAFAAEVHASQHARSHPA